MTTIKSVFAAAGGLLLTFVISVAHAEKPDIGAIDTNRDGQISLDEAATAGTKIFDQLSKGSGHSDKQDASKIIDDPGFKKADSDVDGTLDKKEYVRHLDGLFHIADVNRDSKLDAEEMASPAGRSILKLIGADLTSSQNH